ncbi:MAG: primosomal protein N' [Gemmatimonadetes bacterium]|nr:MAG: primosomal protein N' [Gemmatimonadota bacterium]
MTYAAVVLPVPLSRSYIYEVPESLAARVVPGARVVVPLRRRSVVGIVTEAVGHLPSAGIDVKPIIAAPDDEPAISAPLLELGRWMSDYYGAPLGLSLRAILPGPLWSVARPAGPAPAAERVLVLTGNGMDSLLERERRFKRAPQRRVVYETVEALGGSAPVSHLVEQLRLSRNSIDGLVREGLARIEHVPEIRDPFAGLSTPPPPSLTEDQRRVVEGIRGTDLHQPALIHGVTGSGKTLVYLDLLRAVVQSGNGAILLVPEIALTPQTVARVRGVFGDSVAVLHSGLSDGERADAWRALRRGERLVAVGPRSAVFAPVQRLGAIVVDEEHEPSYKQGSAPRYHARDAAAMRAQLEGARLILGSATPSLETLSDERIVTFTLPDRVEARPLPPVEVVDLRSAPRIAAPETPPGAIPWSEALDIAISGALERGEQVILLLNRRGFATFVQCPACGNVPGCPQCAIALTVHQTPPVMRCHYCGHEEPIPETCVVCGHATQRLRGLGTQQLEHFLGLRYPRARIARMDLDTTSSKWAHHHILDRVARGEIDILLGTQMIAKGLDFPNVTVVGVVDADTGLHFPDFRAGERTFQLVAQVAGRAGRGARGGRVFVQTRAPDHHAIRAAAAHSVSQFAAAELPLRSPPNPPYPPRTGLVRFVISHEDNARAAELAEKVASWLRRAVPSVLGPAPCPLMRLKGKWRWHVLAKSAEPRVLGRVVRAWRAKPHRDVTVDRDPVSLL